MKRVVLVRHSTVVWTRGLLDRAERDGLDVETHVPPDKEGLEMSTLLAGYFVRVHGASIEGSRIFTSPIRRARALAEIFLAWICAEKNPKFPDDIIIEDCFAEIPWKSTRKSAEKAIADAEAAGQHFLLKEFADNPAGSAKRYNNYLQDNIKPALEVLDGSSASVNFVFSHSAFVGLTLWAIEQIESGRALKDIEVIQQDLSAIAEKVMVIRHTSISEIRRTTDGWSIKIIGVRPHLDGHDELTGRKQFE